MYMKNVAFSLHEALMPLMIYTTKRWWDNQWCQNEMRTKYFIKSKDISKNLKKYSLKISKNFPKFCKTRIKFNHSISMRRTTKGRARYVIFNEHWVRIFRNSDGFDGFVAHSTSNRCFLIPHRSFKKHL